MKFFLAGIMQGSHLGTVMHNQDYRGRIRQLVEQHFPQAQVYDPLAEHNSSLAYDEAKGREVFFFHNRMCRDVDVLLAFVPEASMGTAIEMWEAHQCGRVVLSVSPLKHNWAVKFLSDAVYSDVEELEAALRFGHVRELIERKRNRVAPQKRP